LVLPNTFYLLDLSSSTRFFIFLPVDQGLTGPLAE
jgi:hypothetical protein